MSKNQKDKGSNQLTRDTSQITVRKSNDCLTITISDQYLSLYGVRKLNDPTIGHFIWDYHYIVELGEKYNFGLTHQFEYIANQETIKWQGNLNHQSKFIFKFKDNVLQRVGTDEKWVLDENAFKEIPIGSGARTLKCYGCASAERIQKNELHILFIVHVLFKLLHADPPYFPQ